MSALDQDRFFDGAQGVTLQQRDRWRGRVAMSKRKPFVIRLTDVITKPMGPSTRIQRRLGRKTGGK